MYKIFNYEEMMPFGDLDDKSLKDVGYMVDADVVVTGVISDLGDKLKIDTKLRLVLDAKEVIKTSTQILKDKRVASLSKKILDININNKSKIFVDTKSNEIALSPRTPMKKKVIVFKETHIKPKYKRIKR